MQKHMVWLSILFSLGVFFPVFFFTPVAALQDNPDQIQSNKTKRPTVNIRVTATPVSTRESRFHSTPSLESTFVPSSTEVPTQVDTLDPDEARLQLTFDAIGTRRALVEAEMTKNTNMFAVAQVDKKRTSNGYCEKPMMVIPIGLVVLAYFKRRSKYIYL